MKAMVLAAGLGTRLRPLTDDRPKALVELNGRTLLEITLLRLHDFGINDVIINVHHFADKVLEYLDSRQNFGMHIEISREDVLLDTGGGLKKAAWFFQQGSSSDEDDPFLLHNVDVVSNINFGRMLELHRERRAVATLAVQPRQTSRYLLFDEDFKLCGRRTCSGGAPTEKLDIVHDVSPIHALAFSGIHIISPRFLAMLSEDGVFSIIAAYLRLAAQGETILGFDAGQYYWRDLGTPDSLSKAAGESGLKDLLQARPASWR